MYSLRKSKRTEIYLSLMAALFMMLSYSALLLNKGAVIALGEEDGFFEWLDFIFCLISSIILLTIFFKIRIGQKRNNYVVLFLGILFLFGAGEEISWGQRIFGWATPDYLVKYNMQGELTIHNLDILQRHTANRLFLMVSFFYCFFIPVLNRFSKSFRKQAVKYDIPIATIYVGLFFLINYGVSKFFELYETGPLSGLHYPLMEIKECNFLFLWFLISWLFLNERLKTK